MAILIIHFNINFHFCNIYVNIRVLAGCKANATCLMYIIDFLRKWQMWKRQLHMEPLMGFKYCVKQC